MSAENPFQSPFSDTARPKNPRVILSTVASFVFIYVISALAYWLLLLLTFFANSSAYWPAVACGGAAILGSAATTYFLARSALLQAISPQAFAAGLLSALFVVTSCGFTDLPALLPVPTAIAPAHWVLLITALGSSALGPIGFLIARHKTSLLGKLIGSVSASLAITYLVVAAIRFLCACLPA